MQGKAEKKSIIREEVNMPFRGKSIRDVGSTFVSWETISTFPRSKGGKKSIKDTPYKSRINNN